MPQSVELAISRFRFMRDGEQPNKQKLYDKILQKYKELELIDAYRDRDKQEILITEIRVLTDRWKAEKE